MTQTMKNLRHLGLLLVIALVFAAGSIVPMLAQESADDTGAPLEFGEEVEGEFTEDVQSVAHSFEGEENQLVTITMVSPDFDTYLILNDPDGNQVAVDDDSGPGDLNSRIGPITLPADGEYTVIANSYGNYYDTVTEPIEGEYTLSLAEVESQRIEYTQEVKGEIEDETVPVYYLFRGQAGDVVNLTVSSEDLDTSVTLSAGGSFLTSTDSSVSSDGVARISGFTLPSTGDYIVAVSSLYGDETGEFTLSIGKLEVTDIDFGDTAEISFGEETTIGYFRFEGVAGDVVTIEVEGDGNFDTTLTLNGPDNYQVAYADDTNNLDPAIQNLILTQTGSYTILVEPYSVGDEGDVTVSLSRGELVSLDDGPQIVNFSSGMTRDTLTFEGEAGSEVRLTLTVVKGESASPNLTLTQAQQTVSYASATMVSRLALDFTVPNDGPVYVQIDEYSGFGELSIEVVLSTPTGDAIETPVVATEEPVATEAVTAEPTEEATEMATEEPTEEATEVATEEPVVTDEPTEEPTATEEPVATDEPTEEPVATDEPTVEATEAA